MRKRLAIAVAAAIVLVAAPAAFAMPVDGLTGPTYSKTAVCPGGKQIVYATQNVSNSIDFGLAGSPWALDNYQRVITVIQIAPTLFCAATTYIHGSFATTGGPSPGGTDPELSEGIKGTMGAGYRTNVFTGLLRPVPLAPTFGSFSTDYQCDSSGNCPGYADWTSYYFAAVYGFTANWWAYAYTTPANGTWVQRADMTYGDITG